MRRPIGLPSFAGTYPAFARGAARPQAAAALRFMARPGEMNPRIMATRAVAGSAPSALGFLADFDAQSLAVGTAIAQQSKQMAAIWQSIYQQAWGVGLFNLAKPDIQPDATALHTELDRWWDPSITADVAADPAAKLQPWIDQGKTLIAWAQRIAQNLHDASLVSQAMSFSQSFADTMQATLQRALTLVGSVATTAVQQAGGITTTAVEEAGKTAKAGAGAAASVTSTLGMGIAVPIVLALGALGLGLYFVKKSGVNVSAGYGPLKVGI